MAYIDTKYLFQCETCRHHSDSGCDVWCENGEFYSPSMSKIPTADVEEAKRIEIIRDDLKWWLETNTEKGVVYIPKNVVENMIAKMDGGKEE